ncbi:MAG TPA: hypothetical protein VGS79_12310, partial [Puia sp.]|nr:hypothetical protein [Puia sp.]
MINEIENENLLFLPNSGRRFPNWIAPPGLTIGAQKKRPRRGRLIFCRRTCKPEKTGKPFKLLMAVNTL